jgi:beta-lactam-binding protein with PASTA domain
LSKRTWRIIGAVAAALVLGIILFILLKPSPLEMPDVTGLTAEQAAAAVEEIGLEWRVQEELSLLAQPGTVVRTNPPASFEVREGQQVTLFVARGGSDLDFPTPSPGFPTSLPTGFPSG